MRTFKHKYLREIDTEKGFSSGFYYQFARVKHGAQAERYLNHYFIINNYPKPPYKKNKKKGKR